MLYIRVSAKTSATNNNMVDFVLKNHQKMCMKRTMSQKLKSQNLENLFFIPFSKFCIFLVNLNTFEICKICCP